MANEAKEHRRSMNASAKAAANLRANQAVKASFGHWPTKRMLSKGMMSVLLVRERQEGMDTQIAWNDRTGREPACDGRSRKEGNDVSTAFAELH
ncbi:hypothetical protein J2Z22_003268 [Paenibacillus forsythiae]|uniref:Uncharacterized protein n=1 Tax=Paenibacillus forsythiae TaxID=365616 RepID=A0ABU3HA60_9BACL|nr:hypothetical protein [Paenibacillus forsythiae]MDT3427705.1 hypothetical protein [Paenibacillus forsythiae]